MALEHSPEFNKSFFNEVVQNRRTQNRPRPQGYTPVKRTIVTSDFDIIHNIHYIGDYRNKIAEYQLKIGEGLVFHDKGLFFCDLKDDGSGAKDRVVISATAQDPRQQIDRRLLVETSSRMANLSSYMKLGLKPAQRLEEGEFISVYLEGKEKDLEAIDIENSIFGFEVVQLMAGDVKGINGDISSSYIVEGDEDKKVERTNLIEEERRKLERERERVQSERRQLEDERIKLERERKAFKDLNRETQIERDNYYRLIHEAEIKREAEKKAKEQKEIQERKLKLKLGKDTRFQGWDYE